MARRVRPRTARGRSRVGERFTVDVGPVAHGGHCVARLSDGDDGGRVVFVRHALPGERVVVRITEGTERDRFWRGDAVDVVEPSPDRVPAPCPVAGPGGCGGCDLQHVSLPRQRALKSEVVREQLVRIAGLAADDPLVRGLEVLPVPVPGRADDGLRWRTRARLVELPDGSRAMRRHRSHELVVVTDCLIVTEAAQGPDQAGGPVAEEVPAAGLGHRFTREAEGFWQVHPEAPRVLVETVLGMLRPRPGESVLDLYAGVGLFAAFLADVVGGSGRVVAVEGSRPAAGHARRNLPERVEVRTGDVATVLHGSAGERFDLVVLDPPREGAGKAVVAGVAERAPRAVAYVACDPAALARDVALFAGHGYRLAALEAFDLFPMTHHVECVALLTAEDADARDAGPPPL